MEDTSALVLGKASKGAPLQQRSLRHLVTAGSLGFLSCLAALCAPEVGATEVTSVGYLDQGAIEATKPFHDAENQLAVEKASLDGQFSQAMHGVTDQSAQHDIAQKFSALYAQRQAVLLGPLYARARTVIAQIAARRALSVVVDRRIVIVGGLDITPEVLTRLASDMPLTRQTAALPPSNVGYVDQAQINTIERVKQANARFMDDEKSIENKATLRLHAAATDTERAAIADQVQRDEAARQHEIIDPMVDQVNAAIARVADRRGLALVVDKDSIMTGGADVTTEVVGALQ